MKFGKKLKIVSKKKFDSEPVYNEKYLKAKIKPYKEKSTQIFIIIKYQKKIEDLIRLSVILIDSVFRTGKNYYPEVFLEECKYVVKEK